MATKTAPNAMATYSRVLRRPNTGTLGIAGCERDYGEGKGKRGMKGLAGWAYRSITDQVESRQRRP